jgi:hypothetical protein
LAAEAEAANGAVAVTSGDSRRAPTPSAVQAQSRRWWGRAALAASVAVAALFVTRPFSGVGPGDELGTPSAAQVAAIPAAGTAPDVAGPGLGAPEPSTPTGGVEMVAMAAAVADVPRRVTERRTRGGAPSTTAVAPRRVAEGPATVAVAASESTPRPALGATDPFKPQAGDLVARPWPRAVLPGSSAGGAFTASYGSRQASPSFYPFEPDPAHLPSAAEVPPTP